MIDGHKPQNRIKLLLAVVLMLLPLSLPFSARALTQQNGSVGVEGKVPSAAPSSAPTINIPSNGQSFSTLPVTVSGFCPNNTVVEIYKNNVFAGSAQCQGGSYKLQIDLFDGRNDLIARAFDDLNQASPDSATVTVNFSSPIPSIGPRISLTSQFSKRGANPGSILTWPITLSGGTGPYAFTIDWGDKTNPDLFSRQIDGNFDIHHTYAQAGVYNILIRASDANGNLAFLQVVGIGNGPIQQQNRSANNIISTVNTKVPLLPIILLTILVFVSFWLGRRHQLEDIRRRLRQGEDGYK
jgi:hypothetical protein